MKIVFNLGIKTDFYLKYNRTRTANGANNSLALQVQLGCGSLSMPTPVTFLANEFDVRMVLQG